MDLMNAKILRLLQGHTCQCLWGGSREMVGSGMPFDIQRVVRVACKALARFIQKRGCPEPIPWLDEVGYSPAG